MSQLVLLGHRGAKFKLNVTQFRSPMSASITSAQTKKMLQHFPVRAGQPDINFTVKFRNQDAKHQFQAFVRDHQINSQNENGDLSTAVTLWWPERNIENWTGYIIEFKVVDIGFREPAPSVTFGVALIDSLMSQHTRMASFGSSWRSILGPQVPLSRLEVDDMLRPPTPPSSQTPTPPADITFPNAPPLFGGR